LAKFKLNYKRIILSYDTTKMRSAGYFSKMRGVANSAGTEFLYMAWKGRMPSENLAKARTDSLPALFVVSPKMVKNLLESMGKTAVSRRPDPIFIGIVDTGFSFSSRFENFFHTTLFIAIVEDVCGSWGIDIFGHHQPSASCNIW
jgi:hypothetical protein